MTHRMRTVSTSDPLTCEKFINKMLRQDRGFSTKKSPAPQSYQDKMSALSKQAASVNQRQRAKPGRQQSPASKTPPVSVSVQREQGDGVSPAKGKSRARSQCRSTSSEKESWGQMLLTHRSRDRTSTFSHFDPLRTVHFLSKELHSKLQEVLPDEENIIQMVADIQHALKRIPPEVATLLHSQSAEFPLPTKTRSSDSEKYYLAVSTVNKGCQTPPTLYQEDTERFQKIMEENTYRLEASCKQLEIVCTNLQNEKEMTEKELDEAKENVELLCRKVRDLEREMEEISNMKIKQLEDEKEHLQRELDRALRDTNENPALVSLRKLVEELKKQKAASEETCARLEYDLTLLRMEKEKFATMLSVRDREIKDIQDEMAKIQDQVNKQLSKLNGEVLSTVSSMKTLSDPYCVLQDKDVYGEIGDATISSINTNETEKDPVNSLKESPCGDAEVTQEQQDFVQKLIQMKGNNLEFDMPLSRDQDAAFEELLKGMSPSCRAFLNSVS